MRKLIWVASGLLVGLICACAPQADLELPPIEGGGSLVGGRICFEHQLTNGGWERVKLVLADGGHPIAGSTAIGPVYFPADAGPVRVIPNCSEYP